MFMVGSRNALTRNARSHLLQNLFFLPTITSATTLGAQVLG